MRRRITDTVEDMQDEVKRLRREIRSRRDFMRNMNVNQRRQRIERIERSSLGNTEVWQYTNDPARCLDFHDFFNDFFADGDVRRTVIDAIRNLRNIKIYGILRCIYEEPNENDADNPIIRRMNDKTEVYELNEQEYNQDGSNLLDYLFQVWYLWWTRENFVQERSGFTFSYVEDLLIYIAKSDPMEGGTITLIPDFLNGCARNIFNIENYDSKCFLYCIVALKNNVATYANRKKIKLFEELSKQLDDTMLTYPVATKSKTIQEFEEANHITVNIFGITDDKHILPIRKTSISKFNNYEHYNLLFIGDNSAGHYVAIKSLSGLYKFLFKIHNDKKAPSHFAYICNYCLFTTLNPDTLEKHLKLDCQNKKNPVRRFPEKGSADSFIQFSHERNKQKIPVCIYYDTECYFTVHNPPPDSSKTELSKKLKHNLYSYCLYLDSSVYECTPEFRSNYKRSEDDNIEKHLVDDIMDLYKKVAEFYKYHEDEKIIDKDKDKFENTYFCEWCHNGFTPENFKVYHHDHFNGEVQAIICQECNLKCKKKRIIIPVIAHNASNYDNHMLIKALVKRIKEDDLLDENERVNIYDKNGKHKIFDVIPNNDESYKCIMYHELVFIDSLNFLCGSLENLTNDLKKNCKFLEDKLLYFRSIYDTYQKLSAEQIDKYLLQKNYFPYELMIGLNSFDKKVEDVKIEDFYSSVKGKSITQDEYNHFMEVQSIFKFKNLREYNMFYLNIDVLCLQCVFNNFRNIIYNKFMLDPLWYVSLPSLSMDIFLDVTRSRIELISDPEIYEFVLDGMYGGLSYIGKRFEKANNKFLPDYDPTKPNKYIVYQDYNSLYPSVMSTCKLPIGNFKFYKGDLNKKFEEICNLPYYEDCQNSGRSTGYLLKVDIEYPDELHEKFKEYPLFPERKVVDYEELSDIQKDRARILGLLTKSNPPRYRSAPKLITDLKPKKEYVIHYQNLIYAVKLGCKVTKIHEILMFTEDFYMRKNIDMLVKMRTEDKQKGKTCEADTMKKCMNSLYGKTCERMENRCNTKVAITEKQMQKYASNPWFDRFVPIDGDFRLVHFSETAYNICKPVQIGMCILALSKLKMQKYWYDCIYQKYGNKAKLLMTDTDSLMFSVETDDIFKDIEDKIFANWLDGSNLNQQSFNGYNYSFYNVKPGTLNKLKFEEQNGKELNVINKFVGLKAKCYNYQKYCPNLNKYSGDIRCKGLMKEKAKQLTIEDYEKFVNGEVDKEKFKVSHFRSTQHNIYTCEEEKIGLTFFDDKRYFLNNYDTVPYGYKLISK